MASDDYGLPPEDDESELNRKALRDAAAGVPPAAGFAPGEINKPSEAPVEPNHTETAAKAPVQYDTDGYDAPKYMAKERYGAPTGYAADKWNEQHQTPKYAIAQIMQEAAKGKGNLADPEERKVALANIMTAYPGAQMVGEDKIKMPDGGIVDIFEGAGAGRYGIAWQPETGPGGAPLPQQGGAPMGPGIASSYDLMGNKGPMVPEGADFYQKLLAQVQAQLGNPNLDQKALLELVGG